MDINITFVNITVINIKALIILSNVFDFFTIFSSFCQRVLVESGFWLSSLRESFSNSFL